MKRMNKAMLLGDLLFLEQKGRNLLKPAGLGIDISFLEYTLFHKYKMDYLLNPRFGFFFIFSFLKFVHPLCFQYQ